MNITERQKHIWEIIQLNLADSKDDSIPYFLTTAYFNVVDKHVFLDFAEHGGAEKYQMDDVLVKNPVWFFTEHKTHFNAWLEKDRSDGLSALEAIEQLINEAKGDGAVSIDNVAEMIHANNTNHRYYGFLATRLCQLLTDNLINMYHLTAMQFTQRTTSGSIGYFLRSIENGLTVNIDSKLAKEFIADFGVERFVAYSTSDDKNPMLHELVSEPLLSRNLDKILNFIDILTKNSKSNTRLRFIEREIVNHYGHLVSIDGIASIIYGKNSKHGSHEVVLRCLACFILDCLSDGYQEVNSDDCQSLMHTYQKSVGAVNNHASRKAAQ